MEEEGGSEKDVVSLGFEINLDHGIGAEEDMNNVVVVYNEANSL